MSDECLSKSIRRYADRSDWLATPDVPFAALRHWADRAEALEAQITHLQQKAAPEPQDARTSLTPEVLEALEAAAKPHAGARPKNYATTEEDTR